MSRKDLGVNQPGSKIAEPDALGTLLRKSMVRSQRRANDIERRNERHLFAGVTIGLSSICIWVFLISFFLKVSPSVLDSLPSLLWRLPVFLSLEALAWFFLRQYQVGIENLKYFLWLARRARARYVAFKMYETLGANELASFAEALLQESAYGRLDDGADSVAKVMRAEDNIPSKAIEVFEKQLSDLLDIVKRNRT